MEGTVNLTQKHILVIADGRSPTALRWIEALRSLDYRISLISTYPVIQDLPVEQTFVLPVAFSRAGSPPSPGQTQRKNSKQTLIRRFRPLVSWLRYQVGPGTLPKYGKILQRIIREIQPDLVHALRIPYEGMLGFYTPPEIPLVISIWGNDFTLHAQVNQKMGQWTHSAMHRADGLIADTNRDVQLAHFWGLNPQKPTLVVPGGGGISLPEIFASKLTPVPGEDFSTGVPIIVNPRGIRAYVQNEVFFQAIPFVIQRIPEARFLCPAMQNSPEAQRWVQQFHLEKSVSLLPVLSQDQLWSIFHHARLSVSPAIHDGTPNTLLEAMACGSFPIVYDIESLREWITPGENGLLVEPGKPQALADAMITALQSPRLREKAAIENLKRIQERSEINTVRHKISTFYTRLLNVNDQT
ncbi:MAG: hypothetical protein CVU39_04715 [Chloroflexi bacterium HGW-Chloroflexi-10]|nr:MAG: hypothetical protein CVU39_04715 [Chloroflexi bacterium HGW-Chloroflexi-10]